MPKNGGEQVVEVVSHTARKLTDGLHLLGLAELLLETLALCDVIETAKHGLFALILDHL